MSDLIIEVKEKDLKNFLKPRSRLINPPSPQKANKIIVSIVIAGRNSDQWLREAIESAFNQTVSCEIIYADDCSYDNSLSIAAEYINQGLRLLPSGVHTGVCATRNRGAAVATGTHIIFLDSDDRMPSTYVTQMIQSVVSRSELAPISFVYPNTQCFGTDNRLWNNLHWSKYDMWKQNQVSTSSMWNKKIFFAAGGWHDMSTMWDYDLAIRCSRLGTPVAGTATLDYRIHDESQSALLDERIDFISVEYREMIRRKNATVGIGSIISGRIPELFPKWISKLSCSMRYDAVDRTPLFLLLHTKAQEQFDFYRIEALRYSHTFDIEFGFTNEVINYETEFARRQSVCRFLANSCQRIQDQLTTDIVWLIEDDIVVPMRAYHDMFQEITFGGNPPTAVSASYWNRHPAMLGKVVGGWIKDDKHFEPCIAFREQAVVDFCGTGCLMYWKQRPDTPKEWKPLTTKIEIGATAHDWAWCEDIGANGYILMLGKVDCEHYSSLKDFV